MLDYIQKAFTRLIQTQAITIDLTAYLAGFGFYIVDLNTMLGNARIKKLAKVLIAIKTIKSFNLAAIQ